VVGVLEFSVARRSAAGAVAAQHPYYALIELEALEPQADASVSRRCSRGSSRQAPWSDAVLARSLARERATVAHPRVRGRAPCALAAGDGLRYLAADRRDAGLLADVERRAAPLLGHWPLFIFGHLGDGNLHIVASVAAAGKPRRARCDSLRALEGFGSVSAEHGIGVLKKNYLGKSRTPVESTSETPEGHARSAQHPEPRRVL